MPYPGLDSKFDTVPSLSIDDTDVMRVRVAEETADTVRGPEKDTRKQARRFLREETENARSSSGVMYAVLKAPLNPVANTLVQDVSVSVAKDADTKSRDENDRLVAVVRWVNGSIPQIHLDRSDAATTLHWISRLVAGGLMADLPDNCWPPHNQVEGKTYPTSHITQIYSVPIGGEDESTEAFFKEHSPNWTYPDVEAPFTYAPQIPFNV